MAAKAVKRDGKINNKFGKDNAEISRELSADRNEYLEMNNLGERKAKLKKGKK